MNIKLTQISESDFRKLEFPVLFEDKLFDKAFGIISILDSKYKLGWQSKDIKPDLTLINSTLCSIGIDLTFVIFDFHKKEILIKLSLDYFFYETKIYDGFLYIITELEIIKIQISNIVVIGIYSLPDYFKSIELQEKNISVKCINDEIIVIQ